MGQDFALHLLDRLKTLPSPPASRQGSSKPDGSQTPREESVVPQKEEDVKPATESMETDAKEEVKSIVAVVENGKVVAGLPEPKTEAQVAQHIELLLGLVSKAPDLLDE